jgi:hypothetical protein
MTRRDRYEAGEITFSNQRGSVYALSVETMEALAFMHREKLADRCPPLDDDSFYTGRRLSKPNPMWVDPTPAQPRGAAGRSTRRS